MSKTKKISVITRALVFCMLASSTLLAQVAVNSVTNRIYAEGSGSVAVIDGSTDTILTTISIPSSIFFGIGINTTTNKIYLSVINALVVIDGNTNTIETTLPFGGFSRIAIDASRNLIYAADSSAGTAIIDGSTNTLLRTAQLNTFVDFLTFDSRSNIVYSIYGGGANLIALDPTTNTSTSSSIFYTPSGLVYDPVSDNVLIAESKGSQSSPSILGIFNGTSHVHTFVQLAQDNGTYGVGVNSSTQLAYVSTGSGPGVSGHVQVIDLNAKQVIASIPVPGVTFGLYANIGVNEATNHIYYMDIPTRRVSVINGASNTIIDTIALP